MPEVSASGSTGEAASKIVIRSLCITSPLRAGAGRGQSGAALATLRIAERALWQPLSYQMRVPADSGSRRHYLDSAPPRSCLAAPEEGLARSHIATLERRSQIPTDNQQTASQRNHLNLPGLIVRKSDCQKARSCTSTPRVRKSILMSLRIVHPSRYSRSDCSR